MRGVCGMEGIWELKAGEGTGGADEKRNAWEDGDGW